MRNKLTKFFAVIGPGFIIASVVLGPGSITTSTICGKAYAYTLIWVILAAALAMGTYTVMSAKFGVSHEITILQAIADTYGRWLAAIMGVSCFLITASFQFGNNLGVALAMNSLTGIKESVWPIFFTTLGIILVFFSKNLYKVLEKLMMALVMIMIIAFLLNLIFAKPSLVHAAGGFIPRIPKDSHIIIRIAALMGTTFCLHACLYQSYLVQSRGWKVNDLKDGVRDAISGIVMLGMISILIIMTSAAILHPDPNIIAEEIKDAGVMAQQLSKLFGSYAKMIFSLGLWAAAFSSLTVNAVMGGGLLADGLGLGKSMEEKAPKLFAAFVMLVGMMIAVFFRGNKVHALVLAQAATLLAVPSVAIGMFLISNNKKVMGDMVNKWWHNIFAVFGLVLILLMVYGAYVKMYGLIKQITNL
ncbi:Nramp family divalent metal transporter [candidate division KSB1 bacterium]|nr:Nramp family divalent metal transporter [candidate division KSB1 bacterium]